MPLSFIGNNPLLPIVKPSLNKQSKLRSQIGKLLSPAMSPPSDGGKIQTLTFYIFYD